MSKMTFTDRNSGRPAMTAQLPAGFKCEAEVGVKQYPMNQAVMMKASAVNKSCTISFCSGDVFSLTKYQLHVDNAPASSQDESGVYIMDRFLTVEEQLDEYAHMIFGRKTGKGEYYALSEKVLEGARKEYDRQISESLNEMQTGAQISAVSLTTVVRNTLLDGGLGVYEDKGKLMAVCLYRIGLESDVIQGPPVIQEMPSETAFACSAPIQGTWVSKATWVVPYTLSMQGESKDDLKTFLSFAETMSLSDEVITYRDQLHQQTVEYQMQMARIQTAQTQAAINAAWVQQQAGWAASDRLRDSLHQDLENFHSGIQQTMAQNDLRFTGTSMPGESMDDRIQRWRHESMMGVDTYDRSDGTTVEFDNRADRVFENNLDSTQHFGTHNYFDDYVPDGWHELKKK